MKPRAAVFCHNGLGDGIISLIVSNNLHLNGYDVVTYHNGMEQMQSWFSHLPIESYPTIDKIPSILEGFDLLIVFQNDTFDFVLELIKAGKSVCPEKMKVIYPYPTKGIFLKPYYSDSLFDPAKPIGVNLESFCANLLGLTNTTRANGFTSKKNLIFQKYNKRVAIHIASSRPGKNWTLSKFLSLADRLKKRGYTPVLIAGSKKESEAYRWIQAKGYSLLEVDSLNSLTEFIYESVFFIGNDSGLGHLASCIGIPTLTISRRKAVANFWRPTWTKGRVVTPSSLVPNISGFRLRDRHWQKFISVRKVLRNFEALVKAK